ncbi:MAG: ribosome-recycling factor [Patescibacteria group bacterium]
MQDFHDSTTNDLEQIIRHYNAEIASLHSSRATPMLVEDVPVIAYGDKLPLKQVAAITSADARTLIVQPWDASLLKDVQKGIENAHVGFSMSIEEKFIRLVLPQLTQERRAEIVKVLGKKTEEARIATRHIRDKVQKSIEEAFRAKEISEDEKFRSKDRLQKLIDTATAKIQEASDRKESEVATI